MTKKPAKLPWLIMSLCLILGFALAQFFPLSFMKKLGLAKENFGLSLGQEKPKEQYFEVMNDTELHTTGQDGKTATVPLAKGSIVRISEDGSVSVATGQVEPPKP